LEASVGLPALSVAAEIKRSFTVEHKVSLILKNGDRFEFPMGADDLAVFDKTSARHWIAEAFYKAELESPNPMGKLLIIDEILLLAENFKPGDFKPLSPEAHRFLCAALSAMGRPSLTIDLANYRL
jgi:hypothetical protein